MKSKRAPLEKNMPFSRSGFLRYTQCLAFALIFLVVFPGLLQAQAYVGKISKPGLAPTNVTVYEKGDVVCVADKTSGIIYFFDVVTLQELGSVSSGLSEISDMVINEHFDKLYAASFYDGKIAVVDLMEMKFLHSIALTPGPSTFPQLAQDESLDKVYILYVGGFYQVEVATDGVTSIPGVSGSIWASIAANSVTHEVFICDYAWDHMIIVDGVTLAQISIPDIYGAGMVGVNPIDNRVFLPYFNGIFDRNTNTLTSLNLNNDAMDVYFNPSTRRFYTSSEVNALSSIIEGSSATFFNLPMFSATSKPCGRSSTKHLYYAGIDYIGVLDDETQLLAVIPIDNPAPSGELWQDVAIDQSTGRVFVINDGNALDFVTVLQDEDRLSKPPVFLGVLDWISEMNPSIRIYSPGSQSIVDMDAVGITFPHQTYRAASIAVRPGGGRLYVPWENSGVDLQSDGIMVMAGCGSWAAIDMYKASGQSPVAIILSPEGTIAYLPNSESNDVSMVDLATRGVLGTIPVGSNPWGGAVTPDGSLLFVANQASHTVSVIDTAGRAVSGTIPVGTYPWGVAVNPAGTKVYVSNSGAGTVSVIDAASRSVSKTVSVGSAPRWLSCSPDGRRVYVANYGSDNVSVIDTGTDAVIRTVNVGDRPEGICAFPLGGGIYVGCASELILIAADDFSTTSIPLASDYEGMTARIVSIAIPDQTARFAGRVKAAGIPLDGVLVKAMQAGIEKGRATTNEAGDYAVSGLKPGHYDLQISDTRCAPQTFPDQPALIGRTTVVHFNLTFQNPVIFLDHSVLCFGAISGGLSTPAETAIVSNAGSGILTWTATPSAAWLGVTPGSGTGAGSLMISVVNTNLTPGTYPGTIAINAPGATNAPQTITVNLNVKAAGTDCPPFGNFATPTDGATVASSVPVTGWVLDDIGMKSVKIYRGTGVSDRIYIGDAMFVEGARPDVKVAYPTYPQNSRAGWGYMLLTNFLPNGGNGTFTLLAYAKDTGDHEVLLGSKTITCDNAHAVKPFGAIDTPSQGGTASGDRFVNFGWALTPQPNSIATNGSTIWVYVDGVALAHPTYNNYRKDIATQFPGYTNSNAAVGYYYLNTIGYSDGVHTIAWSVSDTGGNTDGIGSRYFTIQNAGAGANAEKKMGETDASDSLREQSMGIGSAAEISSIPEDSRTPIFINRGWWNDQQAEPVFPDADGSIRIEIPEVSRVAVYLSKENASDANLAMAGRGRRILNKTGSAGDGYEAFELVGDELLPLPIGSSFDARDGSLFWQPGPGFLGEYQFVIIDSGTMTRKTIKITIVPTGI